jgi:hypothetical protein
VELEPSKETTILLTVAVKADTGRAVGTVIEDVWIVLEAP